MNLLLQLIAKYEAFKDARAQFSGNEVLMSALTEEKFFSGLNAEENALIREYIKQKIKAYIDLQGNLLILSENVEIGSDEAANEFLENNWTGFVASLPVELAGLKMLLQSGDVKPEYKKDRVELISSLHFAVAAARDKKDIIQAAFEKYFERKIPIEIVQKYDPPKINKSGFDFTAPAHLEKK